MSIRNKYYNGHDIEYYVHSYKKVFEKIPEDVELEFDKKRENRNDKINKYAYVKKTNACKT